MRSKEIRRYLEANKNKNTTTQNLWRHSKKSPKREIHSIAYLPQETKKSQITKLTLHIKELKLNQSPEQVEIRK